MSSAYREFLESLGSLFIAPSRLELVHEVSHASINAVVEEARLKDENDTWRSVIVKTYRPSIVQTEAELEEFIAETKRIHELDHKHLQRLIGVGCFKTGTKREIASSLYLVEEITGQWSLFKMLRTRKLQPEHPHTQWSQEVALGWCIEIAEGLSFLHNNGIVHRDIKPENITMTDTEVFLTEARIADLKPIRRNFRKNAHLHTSPEVQPSGLLPDDPEVRGGSIEDFQLSPDAIKLAISHDHKQDEEGQCSLLDYHRTKSSSLELQTSLQAADSNAEEAIEQVIIQPVTDNDKAGLLGYHITSGIDAALTSLTTASASQTPSIPFKKSSLSMVTSFESCSSDMAGLKSPSGRKMANSSSSSVNLGQEKWTKKLAAALPADEEEEEEEEEVEDKGRTSAIKDVAKRNSVRSHTGAKELPSPMDAKGPLRIFSTPAVLPSGGQKPSALKKEGAPPRRANLRVRFDTNFTNAEGLAPAEDYSLLYAAPEYMRNMTWNGLKSMTAKSDVFAFAVLLYETIASTLICPARSLGEKGREGWHTTSAILADYAFKVSKGFREEIPDRWPQPLKSLIAQCWSQDPDVRPGMNFVLKKLKEIRDIPGVYDSMHPIHVHEDIEIDLEEIQMMEEEEERLRKREKRKQKRRQKHKKSGTERTSASSGEDEDEDEEEDDDPETEHRPSLLARFSNQFSPGSGLHSSNSGGMFSRQSNSGPNLSQAKRASLNGSTAVHSPAQTANMGELEKLMLARNEKIKQLTSSSGQPTCCAIS